MSNLNNELGSLKAKIEQTRAAREAFLRGTVSSSNCPASSSSSNPNQPPPPPHQAPPVPTTVPNATSSSGQVSANQQQQQQSTINGTGLSKSSSEQMSANQQQQQAAPKAPSVASIVRNNNNNNNNDFNSREMVTDKATFIASLNNTLSNGNGVTNGHGHPNGHHHGNQRLYQNISPAQAHAAVNSMNGSGGSGGNQAPPPPPLVVNGNGHGPKPMNGGPKVAGGPAASSIVTAAATTKIKNLEGYVGFANLPNQVYRKSVKKGFEFNLMVIGESGLGKSTFINSLFLTELYNPNEFPGTFDRKKSKPTTYVDANTVLLSEKGVNLRLTIIDTPGFGDSIDNSNCWQPIVEHIDAKYEEYLTAESKVNRKLPINDQRIHCCIYFIAPGHTLKNLDVEVMKKLHDRVNLIPVIAKADTMTAEELKQFKQTVLQVINDHKVQIYEFPDIDDDDAENNRTNIMLKSKLPFAIVGSNTVIEQDGKVFRGRQYPWGTVNVDEQAHCDFMALRTMLIRTHMQDLKDVTNNVHYENYRFKKLAYVSGDKGSKPTNKNPFQQLEEERRENEIRLEKMKMEMETVFDQKVKEKVARLRESEQNLEKQQEGMRMALEREERELEERRAQFLREKQMWEESNKEDEEKLKQTLDKEQDKRKKKIF